MFHAMRGKCGAGKERVTSFPCGRYCRCLTLTCFQGVVQGLRNRATSPSLQSANMTGNQRTRWLHDCGLGARGRVTGL